MIEPVEYTQSIEIYDTPNITNEYLVNDNDLTDPPYPQFSVENLTDDVTDETVTSAVFQSTSSDEDTTGALFTSWYDRTISDCPQGTDSAYWSIIITAVPVWTLIIVLVIFMLVSFHRRLRSTHIYEDCNRNTSRYTYYVELRTGPTSNNYARRRTTLTIDMFDGNLVTVTRLAIPGHIIFGKRDSPTPIIEDPIYSELRITHFWLHRANKLRPVSTMRLTHTCIDSDARILVYGVQIRGREPYNKKLFFPVMAYISAYGPTAKPNGCFDADLSNSVSIIGGHFDDADGTSGDVSWTDTIILIYVMSALIFLGASYDILSPFNDVTKCVYKGLIVGIVCFVMTLTLASILKYAIKRNHSENLGLGFWAYAYYAYMVVLLICGTLLWALAAVHAYHTVCPSHYKLWLLSVFIAFITSGTCTMLVQLTACLLSTATGQSTKQLAIDDENLVLEMSKPSGQSIIASNKIRSMSMRRSRPSSSAKPTPVSSVPSAQVSSYATSKVSTPKREVIGANQDGTVYPFKTAITATVMPLKSVAQNKAEGVTRIGSDESTGSTYYQQLMKTKGGVKSISQYGELLKASKKK